MAVRKHWLLCKSVVLLSATAAFVTLTFTASARPASYFVLPAAQFGQWKIKRETILARNVDLEELVWASPRETIGSGLRDDLSSLLLTCIIRIGLGGQVNVVGFFGFHKIIYRIR